MLLPNFVTELGFTDMEQYFQYILDSRLNGQHKQAHWLFNNLSEGMQGQRADFFEFCRDIDVPEIDELQQYFLKK